MLFRKHKIVQEMDIYLMDIQYDMLYSKWAKDFWLEVSHIQYTLFVTENVNSTGKKKNKCPIQNFFIQHKLNTFYLNFCVDFLCLFFSYSCPWNKSKYLLWPMDHGCSCWSINWIVNYTYTRNCQQYLQLIEWSTHFSGKNNTFAVSSHSN